MSKNFLEFILKVDNNDYHSYLQCLKNLYIKINKTKTIAIGDSIFHDIKGANNFSINSILVKSGIHKDLDTINLLCKNHKIAPTYLIDDFSI